MQSVSVWTRFANLATERQGSGMLLSLEGDGLDAAPEIKMKLTAKMELKSLRQGLSIKYVHLLKQKEKPTVIALIRPKEEIPLIARVMLPDAPFMNP